MLCTSPLLVQSWCGEGETHLLRSTDGYDSSSPLVIQHHLFPRALILLLHGFVHRDRNGLGVGDLHEITHAHAIEVARVACLDRRRLSCRTLQRDGASGLVDAGDGGHECRYP